MMHFRDKIFQYLIFVVFFVPSLAGNIDQNNKPDNDEKKIETKCIGTPKGWKHQVRGKIVHLDEINIHQCDPNTKLLEIFAVEKVVINADLKLMGKKMQVVIIAPIWEVIGGPTIDLSGDNAEELGKSEANNGRKTGNKHGSNGIAGLPGGSAGNFIGVANRIINGSQLSILANGGIGGKGQDGGHGADGEDGKPLRGKDQFDCETEKANGHEVIIKYKETNKSVYVVHGTKGTGGGRGGNGGAKGLGGHGGNIILFDLSKTDDNSSARISTLDGKSGIDGRGGLPGYAGKNGYDTIFDCIVHPHYVPLFHIYLYSTTEKNHRIDYTDAGCANSGSVGTDGKSLILHRIPEKVPIFQNFPHTINEYKLYVRPELAKINDSENVLSFYESLNTRKEITGVYDTLSLVEEFTGLELQGFNLKYQHHLIPSFTALKERIFKYRNNPNYEKEKTPVYQDVMKRLFYLITEKLETTHKMKGHSVMTNILSEFEYNGLTQIRNLEKQEDVNSKLEILMEITKPLDNLIEQANSLISNSLQNTMRDLQSTLDQKMDSLLEGISQLKKNSKRDEKELFESREELQKMILLKKLFGVLKVGCALAELVNTSLGMAGAVVSSKLSIEESENQTNFMVKDAEVSRAVKALSTATEAYLASKKDTKRESEISKIIMEATPSGKDIINRMRRNIDNISKIDEIDKAVKESRENLKKLEIIEEKVYNEALPMLRKTVGFTDHVANDNSNLNRIELLTANWDVSNIFKKVQKILKLSFDGFNAPKEMDWALDNLVVTYELMSKMQEQILKYGEQKSKIEFLAMMYLAKEKEILSVDIHLTYALAKLETAVLYNHVYDWYNEWIFALKQFSFPDGGDILKLATLSDTMIQKDVKHVITDIKMNVLNFRKLFTKESNFDNILQKRSPKLFRGSCSSDKTSFFVWRNESVGSKIDNILSGNETTIVANTPTIGINALKFRKVGILFAAKNCDKQQKLFDIMKNIRVNLKHHGDSIYRFNNKTFEIETLPTELNFNYPSTVNEVMRLPSSLYEKISNGAYMLSPYATWTVKLTSEDATVFESLKEFKGHVDLELIGEGQVFENNQCDKECETNMMKYYKSE